MTEGANLAAVLAAWSDLSRTGNAEALEAILDPGVIWQGLLPEQVCRGREEVLHIIAANRPIPPRLTRMEAQESGDRVVVSVQGPDFPDNEVLRAEAPRSLVLTFHDGLVTRMESAATREAALQLAGITT